MSKLVEEGPRLDSYTAHSVTTGVLYVEEGDTKDKPDLFKWHQAFNRPFDVINLAFTDPREGSQADFNTRLQFKRS
jgi:hypothetical protein